MFWPKKLTEQDILAALGDNAHVLDGLVLNKGHVLVTLKGDPEKNAAQENWRLGIEQNILAVPGVKSARVMLTAEKIAEKKEIPKDTKQKMAERSFAPHVKHIIAVASGKGGVGKSTVAVNLATALSMQGMKVGILDADIYGPSIPMLLGLRDQKPQMEDDYIIPLEKDGLRVMSMGFLVDENKAMIWRGPMVQSALQQLLRDVRWGELDVLVLDMPPGTGDAQLTIAQKVPLAGAVIVSTPQDIALLDATKGIEMFRKVSVPILGLIENMSVFSCPCCGHQEPIFGQGGAEKRAADLNVEFLGAIPLDTQLRILSDSGQVLARQRDQPTAQAFASIASKIRATLQSEKTNAPA